MSPAILQSLMARTRNDINYLHETLKDYYNAKAISAKDNDLEGEYYFHERIKTFKKDVARLVLVKKALKASYFEELAIAKMEHGNVYE